MKTWAFLSIFLIISSLFGQGRRYEGPIDPAGDQAALREGHMSGNRFRVYFNNQGRLGHWPFLDGSKYPANSQTGLDMFDSAILIVAAKVFVEQDSIPVTDMIDIRSRDPRELDSLYFALSGRNDIDIDRSPDGTVEWGFEPVFGYFNVSSESPAISTDPYSWPTEGWPSTGFERKWPGKWNGRFGPFPYAHMESYFVMNDAQDQENLQPGLPVIYSPRNISHVKIGDLRPDVTTQYGLPWGGIGSRVAARGYQWDNPQTRDIVFWEYDITNISDYDLPQVVFGYMMDMGIGNYFGRSGGQSDVGSFNKQLDLSFTWHPSGTGFNGYPTAAFGWAFLESPGMPNDGLDNDDDGLIDEKRDNAAAIKVGPQDGIADLARFLETFGVKQEDLKVHWDADEDQDWQDGNDVNGNGIYDSGEFAGDDVGLDGIAPGESNYPGPDPDGTECNHKPDYLEGIGCEPNFAITDVGESDMLGLSSFQLFAHPGGNSPWVTYDKDAYNWLASGLFVDNYENPTNLYQSFSSGPFPLYKGRTERISMALIAAFENMSTLNNQKTAPIIFERKKVTQTIYESDYRFARPPIMPTLSASPGDGKVILTWDSAADRNTREALMGGENDFEGYRLYKATDIQFSDAQQLRDGFGNPAGNLPVFQCDLDNEYSGFTDFAYVEGEGYFLGNNSGIQHYYVDSAVENGRTYYYYLAAYDRGIKSINIAPSENVATIVVDENERITFQTPNVQITTPRAPINNYVPPEIELLTNMQDLQGTGSIRFDVAEPNLLKQGHTYKLMFNIDTLPEAPRVPEDLEYRTNGFRVYDVSDSSRLVYEENPDHFVGTNLLPSLLTDSYFYLNDMNGVQTDIFDGLQISLSNLIMEGRWDSLGSTWVHGEGEINLAVNKNRMNEFPWQYDIVFTDQSDAYRTKYSGRSIKNMADEPINKYFTDQAFSFYVENKMFPDPETGEYRNLDIVAVDKNNNGTFELLEDEMYVGYYWVRNDKDTWINSLFRIDFNGISQDKLPQAGDVYRIDCVRPFTASDSIQFKTVSPEEKGIAMEENLDKIRVVPNPYIVTNSMEPAVRNNTLNQRRRIMFTNLPAVCTIKIFTMSGYLVDIIEVNNDADNGMVQWDLLTRENLEIAAGIYIYHVKSEKTGKEKISKFAVIK
jgi:hypothetical protein